MRSRREGSLTKCRSSKSFYQKHSTSAVRFPKSNTLANRCCFTRLSRLARAGKPRRSTMHWMARTSCQRSDTHTNFPSLINSHQGYETDLTSSRHSRPRLLYAAARNFSFGFFRLYEHEHFSMGWEKLRDDHVTPISGILHGECDNAVTTRIVRCDLFSFLQHR